METLSFDTSVDLYIAVEFSFSNAKTIFLWKAIICRITKNCAKRQFQLHKETLTAEQTFLPCFLSSLFCESQWQSNFPLKRFDLNSKSVSRLLQLFVCSLDDFRVSCVVAFVDFRKENILRAKTNFWLLWHLCKWTGDWRSFMHVRSLGRFSISEPIFDETLVSYFHSSLYESLIWLSWFRPLRPNKQRKQFEHFGYFRQNTSESLMRLVKSTQSRKFNSLNYNQKQWQRTFLCAITDTIPLNENALQQFRTFYSHLPRPKNKNLSNRAFRNHRRWKKNETKEISFDLPTNFIRQMNLIKLKFSKWQIRLEIAHVLLHSPNF